MGVRCSKGGGASTLTEPRLKAVWGTNVNMPGGCKVFEGAVVESHIRGLNGGAAFLLVYAFFLDCWIGSNMTLGQSPSTAVLKSPYPSSSNMFNVFAVARR